MKTVFQVEQSSWKICQRFTLNLQQFTKYLRLNLVFMWNGVQRKSLISDFQEFSASINKTFILAGRLGTKLSF